MPTSFSLCLPYQRGDSGVPQALSKLQCSKKSAIISLEVNVTALSKELRCDGRMPFKVRDVERRAPITQRRTHIRHYVFTPATAPDKLQIKVGVIELSRDDFTALSDDSAS